MTTDHTSRTATRLGGAALITATLLFAAVFVYLAKAFGYPGVLDQPAAEVLPRLLALGSTGRAVWVVYGLVPLLLLPTAFGVYAAGRQAAPQTVQVAARVAVVLAVLSAVSMMVGLLRWPSLHWELARAYAESAPPAREAITALFRASNSYLGNFIGEFLGELFLNAFFLVAAWVLRRASGPTAAARWLLRAGVAASLLGSVAMLRNAWPGLDTVAMLNNNVLPLWMLLLGLALWRHRPQAAA
ncbi:DUF4386 family protein [Roseateles paludis]|jgi:hypothetical protein|uniref:DUF4386 family protein n=1 Tax=Roseateles paludis TaxID=3145238 RepID=A0ABV0FXZ2_9BURK